jgi:hypothetical protein
LAIRLRAIPFFIADCDEGNIVHSFLITRCGSRWGLECWLYSLDEIEFPIAQVEI